MTIHDDVEEILLDSQTVANRVAELGDLAADLHTVHAPPLPEPRGG